MLMSCSVKFLGLYVFNIVKKILLLYSRTRVLCFLFCKGSTTVLVCQLYKVA
jgi:hypothetical protein